MMDNLIFVFLLLWFLVTAVFLAVDFYFWWMERFPRYKIGTINHFDEWAEKMFQKGLRWLPKVPAVPVTQNKHLLLLDIIQGKFIRKSVQAWQTGGLLIGVADFSKERSAVSYEKTLKHYLDKSGNWKDCPRNVDFAILSYAMLKYSPNPGFLKPAMETVIHLIDKKIGKDGLIEYSDRKNIRYVDTLGLVCPFLVLYENTYEKDRYADLAVAQLEKFVEVGMFKDTFLPVHSYEFTTNLPVGVYGWGRGTGWYLLGLADTYQELLPGENKRKLEKIILDTADYLLPFQRQDGGFGFFLQDHNTYDSSATAILAWFYGVCYEITNKGEYFDALKKAIEKLKTQTRRDGALDYNQGDTVDVGVFSQRYDIMPFAQGMALRAIKTYRKYNNE